MFVASVLSRFRAFQLYGASARELSHLSERELDLGISRYEIDAA